ncbi:hypothetical protein [Paucisalibacillus globulus]|uniref:hypothetical protein n=1 Tax=Paucisalibacillus globulus TaxID=351095 RepID=UPI000BB8972F|nr:hypothetical protein [Paucisalibacillus globulus]
MFKNRIVIFISILISILIIISFLIPSETKPSPNTRIILEHTYKTYIAPGCFEQSNPTNYLEDSTLAKAKALSYSPNGPCTMEVLESEKDSFIISLLKNVGVINKKWDNW